MAWPPGPVHLRPLDGAAVRVGPVGEEEAFCQAPGCRWFMRGDGWPYLYRRHACPWTGATPYDPLNGYDPPFGAA